MQVNVNHKPPLSLVRAMAEILIEHGVDPYNDCEVTLTLLACGFSTKDINCAYDAATMMAVIRIANMERANDTH